MNSKIRPNLLELLKLLTFEEAEDEEVQDMTPVLEFALSDPKSYLQENPDEEWLAQGNNIDELPPHIAQDIFAWNLGAVLADYSIAGDKGDEIAEAVVDSLVDYDLEIELPELDNWFEFAAYIERELVKAKSEIKLITLDLSFSDEATIFLVPRTKYDRTVDLVRFFGIKEIKAG